MKKILLLLCCSFAAVTTFAQSARLGIKGGLNIAKITADAGEQGSGSTGNLTGFNAGLIVDFELGSNVYLQPGLFYTMKGGKDEATTTIGGTTYSASQKTTLHYLEIPVNFLYKIPTTKGKVYFGAGPYLGYGISGRSVANNSNGEHTSLDVKFGGGDEEIKNPDFGGNVLAGFELKNGFLFGINYGFGLSNLDNTSTYSVKNRVFSVSIGYFFK